MPGKYDKAARLLAEGKVRVLAAGEDSITAEVTGEHGTYSVSMWGEDGGVMEECTCPYSEYHPLARCSHLIAVARIWRPE